MLGCSACIRRLLPGLLFDLHRQIVMALHSHSSEQHGLRRRVPADMHGAPAHRPWKLTDPPIAYLSIPELLISSAAVSRLCLSTEHGDLGLALHLTYTASHANRPRHSSSMLKAASSLMISTMQPKICRHSQDRVCNSCNLTAQRPT